MAKFDLKRSRWLIGESDEDRGALVHGESQISLGRYAGPVFYGLVAVLCLWIFVYISGLYPYLGKAGDDNRSSAGVSTSIGKYNYGVGMMLLFKGQTAFFEYDSTSPEGEITLDVKTVSTLGYSDAMQRVKGVKQGTAEFPIETTGLYRFDQEPALGRTFGRTSYSVSWGAR